MEGLSFLVAMMTLAVVATGPTAFLFSRMGFVAIGAALGLIAILMGGYWVCTAPFPISMLGGISLVCGAKALNKI